MVHTKREILVHRLAVLHSFRGASLEACPQTSGYKVSKSEKRENWVVYKGTSKPTKSLKQKEGMGF